MWDFIDRYVRMWEYAKMDELYKDFDDYESLKEEINAQLYANQNLSREPGRLVYDIYPEDEGT